VKKNIPLLYGFSFFDQFMIVIALWVPYLATQGIGMRQFMELQAVFALVISCGEVPSGLLSDLWGRKKRSAFPPPAVERLRGLPHD
jgi:MFS family permease